MQKKETALLHVDEKTTHKDYLQTSCDSISTSSALDQTGSLTSTAASPHAVYLLRPDLLFNRDVFRMLWKYSETRNSGNKLPGIPHPGIQAIMDQSTENEFCWFFLQQVLVTESTLICERAFYQLMHKHLINKRLAYLDKHLISQRLYSKASRVKDKALNKFKSLNFKSLNCKVHCD